MKDEYWTVEEFKSVCVREIGVSARGRTRWLWLMTRLHLEAQEVSSRISEAQETGT